MKRSQNKFDLFMPFRWLAGYLFGFDYFISYSWNGGAEYALALYNGLQEKGMRCFLDRTPEGFAAGGELKAETERATRHSSALVVIAEPNAFQSRYVPLEVAAFESRRRLIIPIDVGDTLSRARLEPEFADTLTRTPSSAAMLAILIDRIGPKELVDTPQAPSIEVVDKLIQSYRYTRRMNRRLQMLGAFSLLFAALAVLATIASLIARREAYQSDANAILTSAEAATLLTAEGSNALRRSEPLDALHRFANAVSTTSSLELTNPLLPQADRERIVHLDAANRTRLSVLAESAPRLIVAVEVPADAVDVRFVPEQQNMIVERLKAVELWDVTSGKKLGEVSRGEKKIKRCWFSPTGKKAIVHFADDPVLVLWDAVTGKVIGQLEGHSAEIMHVAFDHQDRQAVTCAREITAYVWNLDDGSRRYALGSHESSVLHAAFSPDDHLIATACREETARVWNALDGTLMHRFIGHPHGASYVEFMPDSEHLLTLPFTWVGQAFYNDGGVSKPSYIDGSARIFSLTSDRLAFELAGHQKGGMHGQLAGESRIAVSSKLEFGSHVDFRLWNVGDGKELFQTSGEDLWKISRSGDFALTRSDTGAVIVRATSDGQVRASITGIDSILAISEDERWLAARTSDGSLTFFAPVTGRTTFRMGGLMEKALVRFDSTSRHFATLTPDRILRVWTLPDVSRAEIVEQRRVHHVEFDADGAQLLAISTDSAGLYDASSLRLIARHTDQNDRNLGGSPKVWFPAEPTEYGPQSWFVANGQFAVMGDRIWDSTAKTLRELPKEAFDISDDGASLLYAENEEPSSADAKNAENTPADEVDDGEDTEITNGDEADEDTENKSEDEANDDEELPDEDESLGDGSSDEDKTTAESRKNFLMIRSAKSDDKRLSVPGSRVHAAWFGPDATRLVIVQWRSEYSHDDLITKVADLARSSLVDLQPQPEADAKVKLIDAFRSEDRSLVFGVIDEERPQEDFSESLPQTISSQCVLRIWRISDGVHVDDVIVSDEFLLGLHSSRLSSLSRLWTTDSGPALNKIVGRFADASRDGRRLLTLRGSQAWLWNADDGQTEAVLSADDRVLDAVFSPDGRWIALSSVDGSGRVFDAKDGSLIGKLASYRASLSNYRGVDIDWDSLRKRARENHRRGSLGLFDMIALNPMSSTQRERDRNWIVHADFSRDGSRVAFASHDGSVQLVELRGSQLSGDMLPELTALTHGTDLLETGDLIYLVPAEMAERRISLVKKLESMLGTGSPSQELSAALALLHFVPRHAESVSMVVSAVNSGAPLRNHAILSIPVLMKKGCIEIEDLAPAWQQADDNNDEATLKKMLTITTASTSPASTLVAPITNPKASRSLSLRLDAIHTLGLLAPNDPQASEALLVLMGSDEPEVAAQASASLRGLGERAVPGILSQLTDTNAVKRLRALKVLGDLGPKAMSATESLVDLIGHEDTETRIAASQVLIAIGPVVIDRVVQALKSSDSLSRSNAASILDRLAPDSASATSNLLDLAFQDEFENTRNNACAALKSLKNSSDDAERQINDRLLKGLDSPSARRRAIEIIANIGLTYDELSDISEPSKRVVADKLLDLLDDSDPSFREYLFSVLLKIPAFEILAQHEPEGIRALVQYVLSLQTAEQDDPLLDIRIASDKLSPKSIPILIDLLKSPAEDTRWAALDAIENTLPSSPKSKGVKVEIDSESISELVRALNDPTSNVRAKASDVLLALGGHEEQVVPVLASLVEQTTGILFLDQRKDAARMLGAIGPGATSALPNLARALPAIDPKWPDNEKSNYRLVQSEIIRAMISIDIRDAGVQSALVATWRQEEFDTGVRLEAARALVEAGSGTSEMVPFLRQALTDPKLGFGNNPDDYWDDGTNSLLKLATYNAEAKKAVDELLESGSPGVRVAFAKTMFLSDRDVNTAIAIARASAEDEYYELRQAACECLGNASSDPISAAPILLRRLKTNKEHAAVRTAAAESLAKLSKGLKPLSNTIAPLLADEQTDVRENIVHTLGPFVDEAANGAPYVLRSLQDKEIGVQLKAVEMLLTYHRGDYSKTGASCLLDIIEDRTKPRQLSGMGNGVPSEGTEDNHPSAAYDIGRALNLLASFGPDASEVIPRLEKLRDSIPESHLESHTKAMRALTGDLSNK